MSYFSENKIIYPDSTGEDITVDVQNPLPSDGDSVYIKDIEVTHSTKEGWTGIFLVTLQLTY